MTFGVLQGSDLVYQLFTITVNGLYEDVKCIILKYVYDPMVSDIVGCEEDS